jgi:hypothetical protein
VLVELDEARSLPWGDTDHEAAWRPGAESRAVLVSSVEKALGHVARLHGREGDLARRVLEVLPGSAFASRYLQDGDGDAFLLGLVREVAPDWSNANQRQIKGRFLCVLWAHMRAMPELRTIWRTRI